MPITLGSNIASLMAQRQLGKVSGGLSKTFERLSSGLRINHAGDDPAGLAMAAALNSTVRTISQALRNVGDGISAANIAESALTELRNISVRQKELATQAANGVYSLSQRKALNQEANALVDEYNRIVQTTTFNGLQLLNPGLGSVIIQAGTDSRSTIALNLGSLLDRNVGTGAFTQSDSRVVGTYVNTLVADDFNGDGYADLITSDSGASRLSVLLGRGDGTFQSTQTVVLPANPIGLLSADLNSDGKLDLVATMNSTAAVLLNNGNGTFLAAVTYNPGAAVSAVTVDDLNSDGVLDLGMVSSAGSCLMTMIGRGDGTFGAGISLAAGAGGSHIVSGDINGDGRNDLVVAHQGSDNLSLFLGQGAGIFAAQTILTAGDAPANIALADFNNDGNLDILTANHGTGYPDVEPLTLLMGRGDGSFEAVRTIVAGENPIALDVADYNGDGYTDFAVANFQDTAKAIQVFLSNGNGTFDGSHLTTVPTGNGISWVTSGDFNSDGRLDLAGADWNSNTVYALLGQGGTTSDSAHLNICTREGALSALSVVDGNLQRISDQLGVIGAVVSRLEVAVANLTTSRENYAAASARITDVDVAEEAANLVRQQILQQAGAAILAQANQAPQLVLQLLS